MVYFCSNCNTSFEKVHQIKKHLNNKVPCGYHCRKCGDKMSNRKAMERHLNQNDCEPKDYTDEEIKAKMLLLSNTSTHTEEREEKELTTQNVQVTQSLNNVESVENEGDSPKEQSCTISLNLTCVSK